MGEIDFEAEARAWVNWYRSHSVPPLPEHLAIEYERIDARARAEGEADGFRRGVEAAIAPLRGMKTNERAGYMAAIPQTKELCAYTALILVECIGRIRRNVGPRE